MIAALNFKPNTRGAILGYFDLRYYGLTIKGARLMKGQNGMWIAFPQQKGEQNGEVKYYDQLYLVPPEMEHVRRLAIADLKAQGYIDVSRSRRQSPKTSRSSSRQGERQRTHVSPEGEDLSEFYTDNADDDIPF